MEFQLTTVYREDYDSIYSKYKDILDKYTIRKEDSTYYTHGMLIITLNEISDIVKLSKDLCQELILSNKRGKDDYTTLEIYDDYRE